MKDGAGEVRSDGVGICFFEVAVGEGEESGGEGGGGRVQVSVGV